MPGIDSLLRIMVQQDATELYLAPDCPPRLAKDGADLALTMPPMPAATLRALLGEIWSDNEAAVRQMGNVTSSYTQAAIGQFEVSLRSKDGGDSFEATFRHSAAITPPALPIQPPSPQAPKPSAAVAETLRPILVKAVAAGASDVHLTEDAAPMLRVDGELRPLDVHPVDPALLLPEDGREQLRTKGAVDLGVDVEGVGRVRVNVYATADGLAAAIRVLAREAPRLAELNLPVSLNWLFKLPHGLVIVCGPTGSGKSSTLAALVSEALRHRPRHLITLEDPIEYRIRPGAAGGLVRQRQVGTHVSSFATGLRDALREDPDVLLIGEMRDPETISLALTAAETGHLVLTSLHSRTTSSAVERIIDTYPPERQRQIRVQLADSLRVVIAQKLLPRHGATGRLPALEILKVNHAVANLIREGKTAQIVSTLQASGEEGMLLLEKNLAELVRAKAISLETAQDAANDGATLRQYLPR
jgi:twitching motility protein PilT